MNYKLLVIEDEQAQRKVLVDQLKAQGYSVEDAADGEIGLEKVQSYNPDLVLLDLVIPKVDGISVLKQIKANEKTKDISVIVLTNLIDQDHSDEVLELGATKFLIKTDLVVKDVIAAVKEVLH